MKKLFGLILLIGISANAFAETPPNFSISIKFEGKIPYTLDLSGVWVIEKEQPIPGIKCVTTKLGGECSGDVSVMVFSDSIYLVSGSKSSDTKSVEVSLLYLGKKVSESPIIFKGDHVYSELALPN